MNTAGMNSKFVALTVDSVVAAIARIEMMRDILI